MNLTRCQDQKRQNLEEFYGEFVSSENQGSRRMGQAMLGLIRKLKEHGDQMVAFGLTSHARLYLLEKDTYEAPWYVSVGAVTDYEYHVDYLMPKESQPWRNARISGIAGSEVEAVDMILTAMEKSEGWN